MKHTFINKREGGSLLVFEEKELIEKPIYLSKLQEILASDLDAVKILERILLHGGLLPHDRLTSFANGHLWKAFEKHLRETHGFDWEELC